MNDSVKFFLGANSYDGFISYFRQLQENSDFLRLLILKGGPGSGKSSLMKKVMEYALGEGHTLEVIPCASDPLSLDAVIDKTAKFAIMDGTAPHTEDPHLPGVLHHILYLGDLWDSTKLAVQREEIAFFNDLTGEYHNGAGAYIKAAGSLLGENFRVSKKYLDLSAVYRYAEKLTKKLGKGTCPKEEKRFLSAVSVGEIKFFEETLPLMADDVYVIEDEWGGAGSSLIEAVKKICLLWGHHVIDCPCSVVKGKTDHIILPEKRMAIVTSNRFLKCSRGEKIRGEMFYTTGIDRTVMERRAVDSEKLLGKAGMLIKTAKKTHDRLERFYINAMNFSGMEDVFEKIKRDFYE